MQDVLKLLANLTKHGGSNDKFKNSGGDRENETYHILPDFAGCKSVVF